MKCSRLKKTAREPEADDLSFLPPYSEQAKYLFLADQFLSTDGHHNVLPFDTSQHFQRAKNKGKKAA